jgi:sialate O-acetylesterase
LKVPIAVVDTSRGGTPIEPYIPLASFATHPTLRREVELADQNDLAGLKALPGGMFARDANWFPARLFNSRVAPLVRFPVRGVLWYQGESNSGYDEDPRDYETKMRALISGWRAAYQQENLPCYYVQLPPSGAADNWPRLREEQRRCTTVPHSGMVVTIDLAEGDIHPPNKVDVGERLARWALARDYGRSLPFSGPLFAKAELAEGKCIVHFDHASRRLMTAEKRGLAAPVPTPGASVNLFELQNEAGAWFPSAAIIFGATVVVSSAQVPQPKRVRYAVQKSPAGCNLYNSDGLPASPFTSE